MNATLVYICDRCDTVHESLYLADNCCLPDVFEEWQCSECLETFATEAAAEACCADEVAAQDPWAARCSLTLDMFEEEQP